MASEQVSKDITHLWRLWRLVEKLPPGQPVSREIAELEADLRMRFHAHAERRENWRRILMAKGPEG